MWECYAVKKVHVKSLLNGATTTLKRGNSWSEESAYKQELAMHWEKEDSRLVHEDVGGGCTQTRI